MAIVTDIANFYPLRADVDDLASGNNGTNTGVSFVVDGAITVADFNGTSSRFTTPNQVNDPFSVENTTISMWIKTSTLPPTPSGAVISGCNYTSGGSTNPVYGFYIYPAGNVLLYIRSNSGSSVSAGSTSLVGGGSWHHIALVRTAVDISLYVDGALEATTATGAFGTLSNTNSLGVGSWVGVPPSTNVNWFYQGLMSDFAEWRRVLSGAEITAIHAAGVGQLAALMQLEAQGLFGSVVHDLPTGPPIYARALFATVVHEGTAAPSGGGGSTAQGDALQGRRLQGRGLQGNSLQGGS